MSQSAATAVAKKPGAGLEGVVAAQSEICFIDGNKGRLVYRGYDIGDLVENVDLRRGRVYCCGRASCRTARS